MRGQKSIKNKMINHSISGKSFEDFIHSVLTKNRFYVTREVLTSNGNYQQQRKERKIDIKYTYGKMERYIEADGKVHGSLEQPTESTLKRNADFERANLPYTLINQESITGIRRMMQDEGKLKNITEPDLTEFLVTYLAFMEYSKHLAKIEAGAIHI